MCTPAMKRKSATTIARTNFLVALLAFAACLATCSGDASSSSVVSFSAVPLREPGRAKTRWPWEKPTGI